MENVSPTDRIAWLRSCIGMAQKEFAEHCGLTLETYRRIERGQALRDFQILQIANKLNIDAAWLLTGDLRYLILQPLHKVDAALVAPNINSNEFKKMFFNLYPHLFS